jgi:hypothetical protein
MGNPYLRLSVSVWSMLLVGFASWFMPRLVTVTSVGARVEDVGAESFAYTTTVPAFMFSKLNIFFLSALLIPRHGDGELLYRCRLPLKPATVHARDSPCVVSTSTIEMGVLRGVHPW